MNPKIQSIIAKWQTSNGRFSFEKRLPILLNKTADLSAAPIILITFIIDVDGFFLDESCTIPVKLHKERTISIDNLNNSDQYSEDFQRDLNLFTQAAYEEFQQILSSFDHVNTTDPLHSK